MTSIVSTWFQRKHNKNSVRPIIDISFGDYENRITIKLVNNGVGPAILKSFKCGKKKKGEPTIIKKVPIEFVSQELQLVYRTFTDDISGFSIAPNHHRTLLEFVSDKKSDIIALRKCLMYLELTVEYTDIYNKKMKVHRKFDWFARTISESEKTDIVLD